MEVQLTPDLERELKEFVTRSGCGASDVLQDALAGYFAEVSRAREMLDSRYDDLKSGRVTPVDGEEFFESLRRREAALIRKPSLAE